MFLLLFYPALLFQEKVACQLMSCDFRRVINSVNKISGWSDGWTNGWMEKSSRYVAILQISASFFSSVKTISFFFSSVLNESIQL